MMKQTHMGLVLKETCTMQKIVTASYNFFCVVNAAVCVLNLTRTINKYFLSSLHHVSLFSI